MKSLLIEVNCTKSSLLFLDENDEEREERRRRRRERKERERAAASTGANGEPGQDEDEDERRRRRRAKSKSRRAENGEKMSRQMSRLTLNDNDDNASLDVSFLVLSYIHVQKLTKIYS